MESGGTPLEQLAGLEERLRCLQPAPAYSRPVWSARAQPPVGARGPLPAARLRERRAPAAARTRVRAAHYVPRTPPAHALTSTLVLRGFSSSFRPLHTRLSKVFYCSVECECFSCHLPLSGVSHFPRLAFACEARRTGFHCARRTARRCAALATSATACSGSYVD